MEDIKKYAELLSLLEMSGDPGDAEIAPGQPGDADDDDEVREWASLISKANVSVIQKARLRICSAGLNAVHRHITSNPDFHR